MTAQVPIHNLRSGTASKRPAASGLAFGQIAINYNHSDPAIYLRGSSDDLVKVAPVFVGSGAPNATPASGGASGNTVGEQWLDITGGDYVTKVWDGTAWRSPVITSALIKNGTIVDEDINASAGIAVTKLGNGALPTGITIASDNIVNGTIVNADINAAAAIALSKLDVGALPTGITINSDNIVNGSIVNDDISNSAGITYGKLSLSNSIVNSDIGASAGIVDTKLATITTAGKVSGGAITSGTISGSTAINTTGAIATTSGIRAADSDGSNYVELKAPATVSSNVSFTLPGTDGTNGQLLTTNGSGVLSWSSVSAGSTNSISTGDTSVTVTDTGSDGAVTTVVDGSQKVVVNASGATVSGVINDNIGDVRVIPQNSQSANYTLVVTDKGKCINFTSGDITVPSGVFSPGDPITLFNNSTSSRTITQAGGVTIRVPGTATTGNRTLAQYGVATLLCVANNVFTITGAGLS